MKTISKQAARKKAVASVLGSLHIEQLTPSPKVVKGMQACVSGKATTQQLIADVINHHVPLRRI